MLLIFCNQPLIITGTDTYPPKETIMSGFNRFIKNNDRYKPVIVLGIPKIELGRYRRSNLPQGIG